MPRRKEVRFRFHQVRPLVEAHLHNGERVLWLCRHGGAQLYIATTERVILATASSNPFRLSFRDKYSKNDLPVDAAAVELFKSTIGEGETFSWIATQRFNLETGYYRKFTVAVTNMDMYLTSAKLFSAR